MRERELLAAGPLDGPALANVGRVGDSLQSAITGAERLDDPGAARRADVPADIVSMVDEVSPAMFA
jgi:hypothetical protein